MREFTYNANAGRVLFGVKAKDVLGEEIKRLGLRRIILLSTPEQAGLVQDMAHELGSLCAGTFTGATMHTPVDVTDKAISFALDRAADGIVAAGGGSTIGLGKAIALRTDFPQIAIPTTYAGSEMTPILGETKDGAKTTQTTAKVLPEVVIYDVELTKSLPPSLSGTSGINAIAHAVEALYAKDRNPIISMMAVEGIRALSLALPKIMADPADDDGRSGALYGAWLCGTCLGAVGMSLHHKLCHTLGGSFNLPHAETHTIVLPHALAYNERYVPDAMLALRTALDHEDPALRLYELAGQIGAVRALRDLGMREEDIGEASGRALSSPYWNPRPIEEAAIRECIARAWAGEPPRSN